jgi:Flp pilus assembly protein TadD
MRITPLGRPRVARWVTYSVVVFLLPATFWTARAQGPGAQNECDTVMEHAQASLEEGKAAEATAAITGVLPRCPGNAQAYALLGVGFDEQHRYGEAHRAFLRAISLNPTWAPFHNNLAVSYLHAGDATAATAEFRKVLHLDPNNRVALFNLAAYYVERKDFSRALEYLTDAKAERSGDPELLMLLTKAYLGAGSAQKAAEVAQELSTVATDNPKLHFTLGLLFAEHGQTDEAIQQFQLVPITERDYETYQNLGLAYVKAGNSDKARGAFEAAMRLAPQRPEPYVELSRIYVAAHQPDQALFLLTQANKQAPQQTDIVFALAELLMQTRRLDDADTLLADSIRQNPANAMLWLAKGDLLARQHLDDKAIDSYQRALRLDPRSMDAKLGLARIYQRTGKVTEARAEYQAVLHVSPGSIQANTGMGQIAFQGGRLDEASVYLERAYAKEPTNSETGELLATVRLREGKYTEADGILRKLIGTDPDNPRIHYLEGRVLVKLGKSDDSQLEFEKARQLTANSSGVEKQSLQ